MWLQRPAKRPPSRRRTERGPSPTRRFSGALSHFLIGSKGRASSGSGLEANDARHPHPPDTGPRIEWVDATPGAPSRCPLSARAYTLADIYAQPLHVAVASPRPSGRRRAATRPRVRSIQDLGCGFRRTPLPRGWDNRKAGRPKEGGDRGARLNNNGIVVPKRGRPHTPNGWSLPSPNGGFGREVACALMRARRGSGAAAHGPRFFRVRRKRWRAQGVGPRQSEGPGSGETRRGPS
jgi:hypothetical protein